MNLTLFSAIFSASFLFNHYIDQTPSQQRHYVGEKFGGGVVFAVYDDGRHGLIASLRDLGPYRFYSTNDGGVINSLQERCPCRGNPGASSLHNGKENTARLVECFEKVSIGNMYAAKACDQFSYQGIDDWYMPSMYETRALFDNMYIINKVLNDDNDPNTIGLWEPNNNGGANHYYYWTSSVHGCVYGTIFYMSMPGNFMNQDDRIGSFYIRPIRQF